MNQNRQMTENDVFEVCEIENTSFENPYSKEQFLEIIRDETYFKNVFYKNEVLGYITAKKILDEIEICNIAVKTKRNGVGTKLVQEIINYAKDEKCTKIHLEVRKSNLNAIKMYEKNGFIKVGIRKNYYKTEDAILMSLEV